LHGFVTVCPVEFINCYRLVRYAIVVVGLRCVYQLALTIKTLFTHYAYELL